MPEGNKSTQELFCQWASTIQTQTQHWKKNKFYVKAEFSAWNREKGYMVHA